MSDTVEQKISETTQARRVPLFALFAANTISFVGDVLMFIAIPWFVLQTTGSVVKTGIAAFFETLPTIISSFFGSALIDRLGNKRASVVSDITSGVSIALIPLLYHVAGLAFWQLLVLVFLAGLLQAPGSTARDTLVPDLADMAKMPRERANAADDGISRVSRFIGAPLAGILIVVIGTSNLLWLDAASFIVSAALIGLAVPRSTILKKEEEGPYLANVLAGLRFIRRNQLILALVLTVMITNLLDAALFSVALPAYVKHFFGSALALGLLSASLGGAAFLGTIIFGAIGHRLPRRLTFALGFIIVSTRPWAFALVPSLPFLIAAHIIVGLAVGPINPLLSTIMQEQVPPEMRARVFGTITAGVFVGMPLGAFFCGYLIEWVGLVPSMFVLGACYSITTLSLLINPALRGMEKEAG